MFIRERHPLEFSMCLILSWNTIHASSMEPMQKNCANLVWNYKNTTFAIIENQMNDERTDENR